MGREKFSFRLGFTLILAECVIRLGNVRRFPYIVDQYGGAVFALIYLAFLLALELPIVIMEFAVGRVSQKNAVRSLDLLEPKGNKWHLNKYIAIAGSHLLMMLYTTVAGWMVLYCVKTLKGDFSGLDVTAVAGEFINMLGNPVLMIVMMMIVVVGCFTVCGMGPQNGVEKITEIMTIGLLVLMVILVGNSLVIDGGQVGLEFYLKSDFGKTIEVGVGEVVFAVLGQAFFTLSIGIGALATSRSYIGKEKRLTGEAVNVLTLDALVAFMAGLIISPACSAYRVNPDSRPFLTFITLPNVFNHMTGGRVWGTSFLLFMFFASISTVIAVLQNIISFAMDLTGCTVKKAVAVNITAIILLSLSCVLGFNVWSGFMSLGAGSNIQDLEDFIVNNSLLPIGSLIYLLFCTSRYGWGYDRFLEEANAGTGLKFPEGVRLYVSYILPLIILGIFIQGYWVKFVKQ